MQQGAATHARLVPLSNAGSDFQAITKLLPCVGDPSTAAAATVEPAAIATAAAAEPAAAAAATAAAAAVPKLVRVRWQPSASPACC